MKASLFFKDWAGSLAGLFFVLVLEALFMRVRLVSGPVIGVVTGTTACFFVVDLWIQFFKRRGYYNRLIKNTCQMDQAYLVHETMEKPDFYEGQILYEVLEETDRSMTGRVKEYRLAMEGFKEYVELWIHEIKLPVASLRLAIHNQGEKQDPARQKMTGAIHRIQGYLDQILYYVRSENTEKDYRIRYCSLSDLIRAVAMENKDELLGSRIQLEVSVGDIQVLTDEKWLIFILNQLINNSIQYCDREKEEQKICLKAHVEGQRVILQVYDNGIGMPSQDVPRAFEKSFTGENGRNYRRSTGMGLYIVKKMCGRLGHKIWLESTRGEYTKVTLEFYRSDFDLTKV